MVLNGVLNGAFEEGLNHQYFRNRAFKGILSSAVECILLQGNFTEIAHQMYFFNISIFFLVVNQRALSSISAGAECFLMIKIISKGTNYGFLILSSN